LEIFPQTTLPMNEEERTFKYGQFGYGKYMYSKEEIAEIKVFFQQKIQKMFLLPEIQYII
jgi:spore photoproduct lyase